MEMYNRLPPKLFTQTLRNSVILCKVGADLLELDLEEHCRLSLSGRVQAGRRASGSQRLRGQTGGDSIGS